MVTALTQCLPFIFLLGCGSIAEAQAEPAPRTGPGEEPAPPPDKDEPTNEESAISLGFVITRSDALDEDALVKAARKLGVKLTAGDNDKESVSAFELEGGGHLMVARIDVPHPDAPTMVRTPLTADEAAVARAKAHFIVTGFALPGDLQAKDALLARLLAAVVQTSEAEGVMLGHGLMFYKPALFVDVVANTDPGALPVELCVDLTVAPEGEDRMSFLTHGLQRYGREEFYVTAARDGNEALEFTWMMARWMIYDPAKQLPVGDTIGRTAEEKIEVQRVPNPTGEGPEVIRLDLD